MQIDGWPRRLARFIVRLAPYYVLIALVLGLMGVDGRIVLAPFFFLIVPAGAWVIYRDRKGHKR